MNNIFFVLRALDELEDVISLLYSKFSTLFEDDKESAVFFYRLSLDEIAHRDFIKYHMRILSKLKTDDKIQSDIDIDEITSLTSEVTDLLLSEKQWTVKEAVTTSIKLEANAAERHYKKALSNINNEISNLLKHLGKDDEKHISDLNEFAKKYI